jgi:hypothetical protein
MSSSFTVNTKDAVTQGKPGKGQYKRMKAVGPYRSFKNTAIVKSRTACCSEFIPFSYCKREFTLSKGQEYVRKRIGTSKTTENWSNPQSIRSVLESRKKRPRLLAVHEVGSGKTYLGLRVVEDALKRGSRERPAIVIVASPDHANVQTWMKEIFSSNDKNGKDHCIKNATSKPSSCSVKASERHIVSTSDSNCFTTPIFKHWCFLEEFNYNRQGFVDGLYKAQYDQYASSPKYNGTVYIDTHDMVFRALCGFNKVSERWDVRDVDRRTWMSNASKPTLRQVIKQSTRNATIFVDEAHKCVDTDTKMVQGRTQYRYTESLALLAVLMFADDSCRIVLATATPKHTSGLGGMGALGFALYTMKEKELVPHVIDVDEETTDAKNSSKKSDASNSYESNNSDNNNDDEMKSKNVKLSNDLFNKIMKTNGNKISRIRPPALSMALKGVKLSNNNNTGQTALKTIDSFDMKSLIDTKDDGNKNRFIVLRALADVTADVIQYYNAIFQRSGAPIVKIDETLLNKFNSNENVYNTIYSLCKNKNQPSMCTLLYSLYGLVSYWKTSADSTLYPRASMTSCDVKQGEKFAFDKPCVYKLKIPIAPLHNVLLKKPTVFKKQVWALQNSLGDSESMTDEQRLLAILNGKYKEQVKTVMEGSGNNVSQKKLTNSYRIVVSQLRKEFDNIMYGDVKFSDNKKQTVVKKAYYTMVNKNKVPIKPSVIQRKEWGIADKIQSMDYDFKSYKVKEASTKDKKKRDKAQKLVNKLAETLKKTEEKYQRQHNAIKDARRKHANAQTTLKEAQASLNRRDYILEVQSKKKLKISNVIDEISKQLDKLKLQKDDQSRLISDQYEQDFIDACEAYVNEILSVKDPMLDKTLIKELRVRSKKIGLNVMRLETSVASLSKAGQSATVNENLVGQSLAVYGNDSNAPISGGTALMPRFALFSMINLTVLNLVKQSTPSTKLIKGDVVPTITKTKGDKVTPLKNQHGNMMIYVDPAAKSEAMLLVHTLVNQGKCILIDGKVHKNDPQLSGNMFAVIASVFPKRLPNYRQIVPTSMAIMQKNGVEVEELKKVFSFNIGSFLNTPQSAQYLETTLTTELLTGNDSYVQQLMSVVKEWSTTSMKTLLAQKGDMLSLKINSKSKASYRFKPEESAVHSYHVPFVSQLLSVIAHINSDEAVTKVTEKLNVLFKDEKYVEALDEHGGVAKVQRKIDEMKTKLKMIKKTLFFIWRKLRAYLNTEIKDLRGRPGFGHYSTLFRYQSAGKKSLDGEFVLNSLYNQPENNTGDYINAVISDVTHGKSYMNTRFAVLYHITEKRVPLTESQKIQIYGRIDRNCSRSFDPNNISRRIELLPVSLGSNVPSKSKPQSKKADTNDITNDNNKQNAPGDTFGLGAPSSLTKNTQNMKYFATFMPWADYVARCEGDCTNSLYTYSKQLCDDNNSRDVLGVSMKSKDERKLLKCDSKKPVNLHNVNLKFYEPIPESRNDKTYKKMLTNAANAKYFKQYIQGTSLSDKEKNKALRDYKQKVILMRGGLLPYNKAINNRLPSKSKSDFQRVQQAIKILGKAAKRAGKTTSELRTNLEQPEKVYQIQRGRGTNTFEISETKDSKTRSLNARKLIQGIKKEGETKPSKYWSLLANNNGKPTKLEFSGSNRVPAYALDVGEQKVSTKMKKHFDCIKEPKRKGCEQELKKLKKILDKIPNGKGIVKKRENKKGFVVNRPLEEEELQWLEEFDKQIPTFKALPVSERYKDSRNKVGVLRRLGGSIGEMNADKRKYKSGDSANRLLGKHKFATNLEAAALIQKHGVGLIRGLQKRKFKEMQRRLKSKQTKEDAAFVNLHSNELKKNSDWATPGVTRMDIYTKGVKGTKVDIGQLGDTKDKTRLLSLEDAKKLAILTGKHDTALLVSMLSRMLQRIKEGRGRKFNDKFSKNLNKSTLLYDAKKQLLSQPIRGTPKQPKPWQYMAEQFDMKDDKYLKRRLNMKENTPKNEPGQNMQNVATNTKLLNEKPKKEKNPLAKNSKGLFKRPRGKAPTRKQWNPQIGQWNNNNKVPPVARVNSENTVLAPLF